MTVAALCRRPDAAGRSSTPHTCSLPAVTTVRTASELHAAPGSAALRGSVSTGEPVAVERREHGWARVLTDTGTKGWLPERALHAIGATFAMTAAIGPKTW